MSGLSWNVWSAAVPLQSGPGRPLGHPSSDQTRLPAALGQMVLTQIEPNSFRLDNLGPDIAASDWTSKLRPDESPAALGGISSDMPPWTKQFPDRLSLDGSGKDIQAQTGQPQPQIGQPWTRHPSQRLGLGSQVWSAHQTPLSKQTTLFSLFLLLELVRNCFEMEGLLSEYNLKLGVKTMVLIADVMQNCLFSLGKPL